MPVYRYRAIDASGEPVSGQAEQPDERSVVEWLRAQGNVPVRIESGHAGRLLDLLNTEITPRDALGKSDTVTFTRSLATLLKASLPLDRSLEMINELGTRKAVRATAGRLLDKVRDGTALSDALTSDTGRFSPLYCSLVRAGEASARLDEVLGELADTLEDGQRRSGEVRSALIYPCFLILTAFGSVGVLLGYVVPTFEPLLQDAGVRPPAVTELVIATGRFVQTWWLAMVVALLAVGVGFRVALMATAAKLRLHRVLLRVPVLGTVLAKFETARFSRLLGTLLGAGLALPASLRLTEGAMQNEAFRLGVRTVIPEVEAGRGLAGPLQQTGLMPPMAVQLIQIGQESGQLREMLLKTAEIFEVEAKRAFDQALALLTPVLTLLMGVMIAVIITSILFALFSINELAL